MTQPVASWLDEYFGTPTIQANGVALPRRSAINFSGVTVAITDDVTNKRTNVTFDGAVPLLNGGTGALNDVPSSSGSGPASGIRFSGLAPVVNGLASGTDGRRLIVWAVSGPLVLSHENVGSALTNRIASATGADVSISQGAAAVLVYDGTSQRWRIASSSGGGGGGEGAPIGNADTGTINDIVSTSGGVSASAIRFTGAAPTVTGIQSGFAGRRVVLHATGGPIVLADESVLSSAVNRIVTGTAASLTIADESSLLIVYDGTSQRWRVVGFVAAGDLGGTATSQTVNKVKGTTVTTAGGALPVGAVLRSTGVAAADWGPLDLSDADARTGTLPVANGGTGTTTLTFPAGTDTLVARATTDTLSNKTLATPAITGNVTVTGFTSTTTTSADGKVTTTDVIMSIETTAGASTYATGVAMPVGSHNTLDAVVTAYKTDGTASATYKRSASWRVTAGPVVTLVGSVRDNTTDETAAAWDVTLDNASTTSGNVYVTGAAATTIRWGIAIRMQSVIP